MIKKMNIGLILFLVFIAQGCFSGNIRDTSGNHLGGTDVCAYAECLGEGCQDNKVGDCYHTTSVGSTGSIYFPGYSFFIYDGYGDFLDQWFGNHDDLMFLSPLPGETAIRFEITRDDNYVPVTIWHNPNFEDYDYNNMTYQVSYLPDVYLCTTEELDTDIDGLCDAAELRYGTDPNMIDTDGDGLSDKAELFGEDGHDFSAYGCDPTVAEPDSDDDGLYDYEELIYYETDPNNIDTDGDSLSDKAELFGFNGLDLPSYGSDPRHKNLFVEMDYYPGFEPSDVAIQRIVDAFAVAPVSNPDGNDGITLYIHKDDPIAEIDQVDEIPMNPVLLMANTWNHVNNLKNEKGYFDPSRSWAFRYALVANKLQGITNGGTANGGIFGYPGHDFLVTLGYFCGNEDGGCNCYDEGINEECGGTQAQRASTFMHELGHNLGLKHGKNWNVFHPGFPNSLSIMSYYYKELKVNFNPAVEFGYPGYTSIQEGDYYYILDYSRFEVAGMDESSVMEGNGLQPVSESSTTKEDLNKYSVVNRRWGYWIDPDPEDGCLDFNNNGFCGDVATVEVGIDLNGNNITDDQLPASSNEWEQLIYTSRAGCGGLIGDDVILGQ